MRASRTILLSLPAVVFWGGCADSPNVDVLGSYFPAWMECIIIGLAITLIVRSLLIGSGVYAHLRLKPLVLPCMGLFFTMVIWLFLFKN